jgi:dipeptidyl aminopeptidase/acylaminoacyl peptidase
LWQGTLNAGAAKLRLLLKVTKAADGKLSAKLDSLDQGAKDLPVSSISFTGSTLKFEMAALRAAFEGTARNNGAEFAGQWRQGPGVLPLTFVRAEKAPVLNRPQEPKKPYPYDEEEITYENKAGGAKLAGTLTLPRGKGPFPVVLLITGSGPQDRDESLMGHKPFLVLADHLTRKGIAVLRVDDRGVGGSTGDMRNATTADFAGDALAGVEFLKKHPRVDPKRIGLAGHSEGGVIAPMVAAKSRDVAFIVLMAGTGVTGEQVLYTQSDLIIRAMGAPEEAVGKNRKLQETMFAIVKSETDPKVTAEKLTAAVGTGAAAQGQAQMASTPWFRYFLTFDPATALREVKCPVLAINGELDLQVSPTQNLPAIEKALKAGGNKDYTVKVLPKLNHLFQTATTGSVTEYGTIEETMSPVALEAISGWILRR